MRRLTGMIVSLALTMLLAWSFVGIAYSPPLGFQENIINPIQEAKVIILALDNSGSVSSSRLEDIEKPFALAVLDYLLETGNRPQIAVLTFNSTITTILPPIRLSTTSLGIIKSVINGIGTTNELTYMSQAIWEACTISKSVPGSAQGALVLATDGFPTTVNGVDRDDNAAIEATKSAAEFFRRNCSILAVYYAVEAGEVDPEVRVFLSDIATRGCFVSPPVPNGCAIEGVTVDATNNVAISGIELTLTPSGRTTISATDGSFSFTSLDAGSYTIYADDPSGQYLSSSKEVVCQAGQTTDVIVALPPVSEEWRIVLTWGVTPEDLDSHVWTPDDEHIWYGHNVGYKANLDVDDTSSFGPETVAITRLVDGTYVYAVKHYAGAGTLMNSGAQVQVFSPTGLVRTFTNPSCSTGGGSWWIVFKLHVNRGTVQFESIDACLEYFDQTSNVPPAS